MTRNSADHDVPAAKGDPEDARPRAAIDTWRLVLERPSLRTAAAARQAVVARIVASTSPAVSAAPQRAALGPWLFARLGAIGAIATLLALVASGVLVWTGSTGSPAESRNTPAHQTAGVVDDPRARRAAVEPQPQVGRVLVHTLASGTRLYVVLAGEGAASAPPVANESVSSSHPQNRGERKRT